MEYKFSSPSKPFSNNEEEISHLRKLIAEKEAALEKIGIKKNDLQPTRQIIAQYKVTPEKEVLDKSFSITEEEKEEIVLKISPEEHDSQVSSLVLLAKEKGIKNALSVVEKMNNFHITDDFHRFLSEYLKEGFTISGFDGKERMGKSLKMSLYEVLIPESLEDSGTKSLKEIISGMEQFYAGMLSISSKEEKENWMALEIANANYSEEIVFYVSIPESKKMIFEKQILSIFNNAKVNEKPDDYNIFNEAGFTAGAVARSSNNPIFPIKTYENFDHDPLNVILSSFSKVNKDGEGAAIQLIWKPVGDVYTNKYKGAIRKIEKGEPLKDAIDIPESVSGEVFKTFKDLVSSSIKKDDEENKKEEPVDETALKNIRSKVESPIVKCNLRIIASSSTETEAEEILESIKSSFNQFQNTTGNSIEWKSLKKVDLRNIVKNFSFRMYEDAENLPLNLKEVTTLMHFHTLALK